MAHFLGSMIYSSVVRSHVRMAGTVGGLAALFTVLTAIVDATGTIQPIKRPIVVDDSRRAGDSNPDGLAPGGFQDPELAC